MITSDYEGLDEEILELIVRTRLFDDPGKGFRWTEIRNHLLLLHPEWSKSRFNVKLTRALGALEKEGDIVKEIIGSKNVRYHVSQDYLERTSQPEVVFIGATMFIDPSWDPSEEDFKKFKRNLISGFVERERESHGLTDESIREYWGEYWKKTGVKNRGPS